MRIVSVASLHVSTVDAIYNIGVYTTLTNFSTKYLVMCKVYTDVSGIKLLYHVCPHVR